MEANEFAEQRRAVAHPASGCRIILAAVIFTAESPVAGLPIRDSVMGFTRNISSLALFIPSYAAQSQNATARPAVSTRW